MKHETYKTRAGTLQYRPILSARRMQSIMMDGRGGFCLACAHEQLAVEPDARRYPCESCGAPKVYGLEELLMIGLAKIR